jgi:hypothetical protein
MATFQQLMDAAVNADTAGDEDAARQLVKMAQSMKGDTSTPKPKADSAWDEQGALPSVDDMKDGPKADRFGDTIESTTRGPRRAVGTFARAALTGENSPTASMLPDGTPEMIKQGVGRVGDAGLTALSAVGTGLALGAGVIGETFGGSPSREKMLAGDLMGAAEVVLPEMRGPAMAVRASKNASQAMKAVPKSDVQRMARAADDLDITPSLGAGGKVRAMTAAGLEKVPLTGGVIGKDSARFVGEVERAFDRIRAPMGVPRSSLEAGQALQDGADKFIQQFRTQSETLYSQVAKTIPSDTVVSAPNTSKVILDAVAPFAGKPELSKQLGLNKWANIATDLEGGLSWQAAAALRSDIGKSIGKMNGPLADMDQGRLKQAYAALTDDLGAAAKSAGPDAEKAWKRANNYYKRGAERISTTLDKNVSGATPERAFEAVVALTKKDRSTADANRLFRMKSSMPDAEWKTVTSSIVDRLGKATAGTQNAEGSAFSPTRFLTSWNQLSDEAKSALFPPSIRKEMNKLATVSEGVKRSDAERNFSNTGTASGMSAALVGGAVDMGLTATALAASNISARALTNQRFLTAMNRAARGDMKAMRALAKGNNPYAQDATTILRVSSAQAATPVTAANDEPSFRAVQ